MQTLDFLKPKIGVLRGLLKGIERVKGRKARGFQVAGGNKLQVADVFLFPSLHRIKSLLLILRHLVLT